MIERYLEMRDGHRLFLRCWNDVSCEPVATLHINHGMAEHSLRYDDFARYLNARGIVVYAQDHRGHGLTKEEEEKGWFAPSDGWSVVTGDAIAVDQLVMNEYENLPHFVMGHSMGSFITRTVLTKVSDYFSAAIISPKLPSCIKSLSGRPDMWITFFDMVITNFKFACTKRLLASISPFFARFAISLSSAGVRDG